MTIKNHEPQPTTLTVDQTARTLGLSRSTVFKFITSGELPSLVMGGRRLVEYSDVLRLIEAHKTKHDDKAGFRSERAKRGVEVRSKRRSSPAGVSAKREVA